MTLNFNFGIDATPVKWDEDESEKMKRRLHGAVMQLKQALHMKEDYKHQSHITNKTQVLKKLEHFIKEGKPKRGICSVYDSDRDSAYELFRTYYKLVQNILIIEKRQSKRRSGKTLATEEKRDACAVIQYAYWRWVDIGTPSISGYNRYREIIKYGTLFLTLIANGFKLALARMGGRASFVGTALQGLAHLSFALYFIFLTQDDKALALPKIVGLIISIVSCIWIADAGNGYL